MQPQQDSFYSFLSRLADRSPDLPLLGGPGGWVSAKDALQAAEEFSQLFRHRGIRRGRMVALRAVRSVRTVQLLLGLRFAGAVVVLTDPRHSVQEFLRDCEPELNPFAVVEVTEDGNFDVAITESQTYADCLCSVPGMNWEETAPSSMDPAFMVFTSGSTGKSRGVLLSEYNLVNNIVDSAPLGDYRDDDIALGALPMDHVFGLALLTGALVLGYGVFFPEKTDVQSLLETIELQKITRMNSVPSLYKALAENRGPYDISSLRAGFIGGGPITPEGFRSLEQELGMTLIPVYGMSECIGISCGSWQQSLDVRASGVGPFYSMNTGRILREDGQECAIGETGEICVDGPARMICYWGDTEPRFPMLHTGDLGYLDDSGILHLTGRKREIIVRNGNNLSARRIEDALKTIPGVQDAAVVALPDEAEGELPYAMAVCEVGAQEAVDAELKKLLHKNELPAGILFADRLPQTRSGKPDKPKIHSLLAEWRNGWQNSRSDT